MIELKIHRLSGVIVGAFAAAHLVNHLYAISGIERHISVMESLRSIYRNPILETILVLCILSQIITGAKLLKRGRQRFIGVPEKIQFYSGLYLAVFLFFHTSAIFAGRFLLHLDTNFYFGAAGLLQFPLSLFFMPWYFLSVVALFAHAGSFMAASIPLSGKMLYCFITAGGVVAVIILLAFSGAFYDVRLPAQYMLPPFQ